MAVDWSQVTAEELYDLSSDTGRDMDFAGYAVNVAAQHADTLPQLRAQLRAAQQTWP